MACHVMIVANFTWRGGRDALGNDFGISIVEKMIEKWDVIFERIKKIERVLSE